MVIMIDTSGEEFHAPMLSDGSRAGLLDRTTLSRRLEELFRETYSDIRHAGKTDGVFIDSNVNKIGYGNLERDEIRRTIAYRSSGLLEKKNWSL